MQTTTLLTENFTLRKSTRRDPWSEAEAREALAAASRSGLSLSAFSRKHGLSDRTLYWWHMRIRTHQDLHTGPLSFVPVVPLRAPAPPRAVAPLEVVVGPAVVRVGPDFCEDTLARVVGVLRGLPC